MSFTVTNIGTNATIGSTTIITVGASIAAGTDVIVCVTDPNPSTGSCSDSQSNTYTIVKQEVIAGSSSNGNGYAFRSNLATGLGIGDTITYHAGGSSLRSDVSAFSVTGGNGIDTSVTAGATSISSGSNAPSVTSGTPGEIGELFVGVICQTNTRTLTQPAGGWAPPPNAELLSQGVSGGNLVNSGASALTYNPTLSGAAKWAAIIFSIKAAAPALTWFPMDVEKQPNFAKTDVIGY